MTVAGDGGDADGGDGHADTADFTVNAEMGFTHRELLNGMPAAVAPYTITEHADRVWRIEDGERRVLLTLAPERRRPVANLRVPVTGVKLEFFNFNQTSFESFMQRYKKYLHKGGG